MVEPAGDELTTVAVPEHPAVRAWVRARPGAVLPTEVTLLKRKEKSAVYRLAGVGPGDAAVVAKHCRPGSARVERVVYGAVLPRLPVTRPGYYGCAEGPDGWWVFLEEVVADKYSAALEEHRRLAGRWLGLLHTSAERLAGDAPLPDRGPVHYRQVLGRVRSAVVRHLDDFGMGPGGGAVLEALAAGCDALAARWDQVEQLCTEMPRTLVHGDFIKRNLRVRPGPGGPSLVAFDWEVAGWGVPAADLAGPPFSGNPDLAAYGEVVREHWPGADPPAVRRWAALGTLFRCLSAADWAAPELAASSAEKALARLAVYPGALADAFRMLGWEDKPGSGVGRPLPDRETLTAGLAAAQVGPRGEAISPIP
jgi:Phosphotransferase enzyme family